MDARPAQTTRDRITLLHVSDPQFGRNHRFGNLAPLPPDDTFDTLLARLGDDLQYLEREHGLRSDLVVLSGDLAEWGLKPEFDDLLPFVEGLIQLLKLPQKCGHAYLDPDAHPGKRPRPGHPGSHASGAGWYGAHRSEGIPLYARARPYGLAV